MGYSSIIIRWVLSCLAGLILAASLQKTSIAATRVALVVGNANYDKVPSLRNARNDAEAIATKLRTLGYATTIRLDLDRSSFVEALSDFSVESSAADVSLVYFAGHGIEVAGQNYLIPTDARLKSDAQVRYEAINVADVVAATQGTRRLRVILLDACRDNPFLVKMAMANGTRSVTRGLAPIEVQTGLLVSYAAEAGTVAADGVGENSPYAKAILETLDKPGVEVGLFFRQVAASVQVQTSGKQTPFEYQRLPPDRIYLGSAQASTVPDTALRKLMSRWALSRNTFTMEDFHLEVGRITMPSEFLRKLP
jgi:uncharacterized caspase-like protein